MQRMSTHYPARDFATPSQVVIKHTMYLTYLEEMQELLQHPVLAAGLQLVGDCFCCANSTTLNPAQGNP